MAENKVADSEHLCRVVRRVHQITDGNGAPIGITWAAFQLREGEAYLSVNWIEAADSVRLDALRKICAVLRTKLARIDKCLLTCGNVGQIKQSFLPHPIRVTSEAKARDPYYAAVRRYPPTLERQMALEKLAAQTWKDWIAVSDL